MGLLDDLEKRLGWVRKDLSDAEALAHTKVGEALLGAAQEVLGSLPETAVATREASLVVTKIEEAAQWAHKAVSDAFATATEPEPAPVAVEAAPVGYTEAADEAPAPEAPHTASAA